MFGKFVDDKLQAIFDPNLPTCYTRHPQASFDIDTLRHLAEADSWVECSLLTPPEGLGKFDARRAGGQDKGDGSEEAAKGRLQAMLRRVFDAVANSSLE